MMQLDHRIPRNRDLNYDFSFFFPFSTEFFLILFKKNVPNICFSLFFPLFLLVDSHYFWSDKLLEGLIFLDLFCKIIDFLSFISS